MNDGNILLSIESWITSVVKYLSYVAAVCAAFTMLIAVADVVGVKLFEWAVPSSVEFIEELMVLIVFLCIAYVELERGHIRVTIIERFIPGVLRYIFRLFGYLVGILIIGFMSWRGFELVRYSFEMGLAKTGTVRFPLWPSHMAVFIGLTCLTIVYILLFSKMIVNRSEKKDSLPADT